MDTPASFWALSQSLLCRAQESIFGPFMYERQSATLRNGVVNWRLSPLTISQLINLSKNNSDLSRSPLKIGGGTPESARLPPLLGGLTEDGAGALIVAPMYSKPLVSMGAVAAMLRGSGVVSGACIM